MPFYEVTWVIELDADTPEDAALAARGIQLDPANIATFYDVREIAANEAINVLLGDLRMIDTDEIVSFEICDFCKCVGELVRAEMRVASPGGFRQGMACEDCLADPDADIYPI